jgi:hypothetical protein
MGAKARGELFEGQASAMIEDGFSCFSLAAQIKIGQSIF